MKTGTLSALISLLICTSLSGCGPSQTELNATATQIAANISATQTAQAPTPTFTPTPGPTRTLRLEDFPVKTPQTCQEGPPVFYGASDSTKVTGKVDGRRFYEEAEALTNTFVEINARVVEAQFHAGRSGVAGATFVLVLIPTDSSPIKYYPAVVFLPEVNAVDLFPPHSTIQATGDHLGLITPPENFFAWFPNKEGNQLPTMRADFASGGCNP